MLRTFAAILAAAGLACAAAPASEPTSVIPAGVTVAGVQVGGLSAEPARAAIDAAFTRPVTIVYGGRQTIIDPAQIGAGVDADAAVRLGARRDAAEPDRAARHLLQRAGGSNRRQPRGPRRPAAGRRAGDRRDGGGAGVHRRETGRGGRRGRDAGTRCRGS